jgi:hypothetical protein
MKRFLFCILTIAVLSAMVYCVGDYGPSIIRAMGR